jgi:hypothetical protein
VITRPIPATTARQREGFFGQRGHDGKHALAEGDDDQRAEPLGQMIDVDGSKPLEHAGRRHDEQHDLDQDGRRPEHVVDGSWQERGHQPEDGGSTVVGEQPDARSEAGRPASSHPQCQEYRAHGGVADGEEPCELPDRLRRGHGEHADPRHRGQDEAGHRPPGEARLDVGRERQIHPRPPHRSEQRQEDAELAERGVRAQPFSELPDQRDEHEIEEQLHPIRLRRLRVVTVGLRVVGLHRAIMPATVHATL